MDLASLGMQAASQAASQGAGMALGWADELIMGNYRRKKQLEQQQALTNQQVAANKELALHNKELEFDLWNKTNYEAQVAHMKNAGLNPALMYGQAGQGVTGTAGQSAGGGHASDEASRQQASVASAGMALQLSMQQAQIENIKAQTEKTKAETENVGSSTQLNIKKLDEITQSIEVMKSDISLKGAQKELTELQSNSTKIANEFNSENNKSLIKQNVSIAEKLLAEAQLSQQSIDTILKTLRANLANVVAETSLKYSNIKLNDANIEKLLTSITIDRTKLVLDEEKLVNDWNIAVMNNSSGSVTKEVKGISKMLVNAIKGVGINIKDNEDLNYKKTRREQND